MAIRYDHVWALETVKRPADAPFDRMLTAQAKAEGMLFVTHDALLTDYHEECIVAV